MADKATIENAGPSAGALTAEDRRALPLLAAACLATFFLGLGAFGIIDPGDGYFSEAAREMAERGDYVTPYLNYQIYFSKPIMIYWLIGLSYKVFGVSEFAARVPGAVMTTLLAMSTYWTVRSCAGWRVGLTAGLIFASSPLVVTFARLSMVDAPFSAFVGLAVNALVMTVFAGSRRWWPVFWAALALSVLTKGPVGIVLVGLSAVLFFLVYRPHGERFSAGAIVSRCLSSLRPLHVLPGILIFLVIVLPWHVAVAKATNWLFLKVFYLYENLGRFKGQTNHEHREPWFYLLVFAYGFAPWVLFAPAALRDAFRGARAGAGEDAAAGARLFYACFAVAVFGFFTLSVAKLQTYMLPAFPAFAAVVSFWLVGACAEGERAPRTLRLVSAFLAFIGVAALIGGPVAMVVIKHTAAWARVLGCLASVVVAAGFVWQFRLLASGKPTRCLDVLLATAVAGFALATPVAFEIGYSLRQAALHEVLEPLKGRRLPVAFFREFKPGVMFYLRQPVDSFFSPDQLLPAPAGAPPQMVIASAKSLPLLVARHGEVFKPLKKNRKWGVYEAEGLRVQKLPTLEETFSKNIKLDAGGYTWGTLPFAGGKPPWQGEGGQP